MLSLDANILFYAFNADCPQQRAAEDYLKGLTKREDIALSEFVLCEFYVLLCNPAILKKPLSPGDASEVIQIYRSHPAWKIVGFPAKSRPIHNELWTMASKPNFARRRIFDARTALTLLAFGVKDFATANIKDFEDLGFDKIWNPLE
ncbi:MAG: VapC toxin family PIN domain ribonuclease [Verrucomicrobia bacterium]|nr:VapC toxin family PIN domain ribonuclease [Verrucomicrobiota bacterium]MDA1066304.1 VapC toxin family PIN domain ribonuclease [Verrucomicrobiota bacterium]